MPRTIIIDTSRVALLAANPNIHSPISASTSWQPELKLSVTGLADDYSLHEHACIHGLDLNGCVGAEVRAINRENREALCVSRGRVNSKDLRRCDHDHANRNKNNQK